MINTFDSKNTSSKNPSTAGNTYPRIGNLELIKTLSYGVSCKVKLGRNMTTKKEYAVKIIKSDFHSRYLPTAEHETRFLSLLNKDEHKNIVRLVESIPKADYVKKNGEVKKVFALVFELAEGGDLFECLKALDYLREDIARTFFHELIGTIEFLHEKGIIHRDIKPDNLLIGGDFSLKIADFSFATFALTENDTPLQREILGTVNYMAPELLANRNYVGIGQCIDLFSCGVILFLMVVGLPPFEKATESDLRYKLIIKQQFSLFWKQHERGEKTFSKEFKSLINAMLAYDPAERLTISEIKKATWYLGKTCTPEELKEEYEKKKNEFLRYQEEKAKESQRRKENKAMLQKKLDETLNKPKLNYFHMMKGITPLKHRSMSEALDNDLREMLESSEEYDGERNTREYVYTGYRGLTEVFYNVSQETLFKIIILLTNQLFNAPKVHSQEYKVKGRVISDNNEFSGIISMKITKVDDFSSCLSFTRIQGPLVSFYKYIEERILARIDPTLKKIAEALPE